MAKLLGRNEAGLAVMMACNLLFACAQEREPHAGYSDPCSTAISGALGCPAAAPLQDPDLYQACSTLVGCGILADSYLHNSGNDCVDSNDCDKTRGGECLQISSGTKCHYPYLDFFWCTSRFITPPRTDPCDEKQSYTEEHAQNAVACIVATPCASLGLNFSDKHLSSERRPKLDEYTCKDGKKKIWTASVCDQGILNY
jgi:hypothetical protein